MFRSEIDTSVTAPTNLKFKVQSLGKDIFDGGKCKHLAVFCINEYFLPYIQYQFFGLKNDTVVR